MVKLMLDLCSIYAKHKILCRCTFLHSKEYGTFSDLALISTFIHVTNDKQTTYIHTFTLPTIL